MCARGVARKCAQLGGLENQPHVRLQLGPVLAAAVVQTILAPHRPVVQLTHPATPAGKNVVAAGTRMWAVALEPQELEPLAPATVDPRQVEGGLSGRACNRGCRIRRLLKDGHGPNVGRNSAAGEQSEHAWGGASCTAFCSGDLCVEGCSLQMLLLLCELWVGVALYTACGRMRHSNVLVGQPDPTCSNRGYKTGAFTLTGIHDVLLPESPSCLHSLCVASIHALHARTCRARPAHGGARGPRAGRGRGVSH